MSEQNTQQVVDSIKQDIIQSYEQRATSLTGDPVVLGRGQGTHFQHVDDSPFDLDAIPGLDPDAVAPDGVDAAADDSDCPSGACKI